MQTIRKTTALHYLTIILLSVFVQQCADQEQSKNGNVIIPAVEAVQAKFGALPLTERFSGLVKAKNQIEIYPQITGVIVSVLAENGDFVKKGQTLVQIRDTEYRERLKQSEASLKVAKAQLQGSKVRLGEVSADLKRMQSLFDKGLASDAELQDIQTEALSAEADVALAQARVLQARAGVEERRELLEQATITAPISGTIGNRRAETGMRVSTSNRLFTLGQLDSMRVEIVLTDYMISYISEGQRCEIVPSGNSSTYISAPITRISPFLHPVTHSTTGEIDVANMHGRLLPGMFVTVDVFYGESEQATLVPLSALYENPNTGETGVFITDLQKANESPKGAEGAREQTLSEPVSFKFVPVEIIAKGRMHAGISGIDPGMWVVTVGQDLLSGKANSARVRTVEWGWVEELQSLQREDLLNEIMQKQQRIGNDSSTVQVLNAE